MSDVVAPESEEAIAVIVAAAARSGEPLLVEGRGSKRGMLRPVKAARTLSTRNHTGLTLYAPKELVISARTGTTMAEIESVLEAEYQHMIAEPPDLSRLMGVKGAATLGGIAAANLSGPRRVALGAIRDHVLGMRIVNGAGQLVRSGGRVLKNVTGLDLCKLLTGSHGTLGVITEVTLKVLPAPESTGTLVVRVRDAVQGVAVLSAALGSPFGVTGAAFLPGWAAPSVGLEGDVALIRIEEFAPSVAYRLGRLREASGGEILDNTASRGVWLGVRDAAPLVASAAQGEAVWRVSVRPSEGPKVLSALAATHRGFLDWGGGLVWLAGEPGAANHDAVMAAARASGGVWMLLRAPDALRASVAVVPPEVPALAEITRRVKAAMDPAGILSPGRLLAEI
jgi:glycolate oxidase FAD binding subunit